MAKKLTTAEFIEKAKKTHGRKYDYSMVEYENNKTKVCIGCPIHGFFSQTPDAHMQGHGCRACAGTKQLTTEQFIEKAKKLHGSKYNYDKVEYKLNSLKVKIGCAIHGVFLQKPNAHLNGQGCPECGGKVRLTSQSFITKANKVHNNIFDYSEVNYKKNNIKVTIICGTHGPWRQTPNNHLRGQGCPSCRESKGEREMAEWLDALDIPYMREHRFKGLPRKPYDFYLPDHNLLIEIDGIQHREPVAFCGCPIAARKRLTLTQKSDRLKDKYAKDNNINIVRIEYET